uniref:Uncharacterized protein n=2 Tax=Odontella aurita TaxID=265563 RepID=A0A7S4JWE5_9STRA|mmetsp:Transcript_55806/g.167250  ORF Transcript_55806/g.167250 Transcript_55806/m.167250 type:complete len:207 (+) Transcript_55806:1183-1803(+)
MKGRYVFVPPVPPEDAPSSLPPRTMSTSKRKASFASSRCVSSSDLSLLESPERSPSPPPVGTTKRRKMLLSLPSSKSSTRSPQPPRVTCRDDNIVRKDGTIPSVAGLRLLFLPEDSGHLNPLHCFVRRQIEIFVATPEDAAAPSPGRKKPVNPGQVGLRCIHCRALPSAGSSPLQASALAPMKGKKVGRIRRVKRAVCYPSSVLRV